MGLYQGPIDAIIGVLTREAIREYQKKNGAAETGYLTPDQLQALTASSP
jgi:peptidoglycan hydrolase-like protein with peptidoglycan-binding domain